VEFQKRIPSKIWENHYMNIEKILSQRLVDKGIELPFIPRIISDMINSFSNNPAINLHQANEKLTLLGWNDIDIDYHTFQLAKACFENNYMNCSK
jgi:hypothetical protein